MSYEVKSLDEIIKSVYTSIGSANPPTVASHLTKTPATPSDANSFGTSFINNILGSIRDQIDNCGNDAYAKKDDSAEKRCCCEAKEAQSNATNMVSSIMDSINKQIAAAGRN